jgi:hypothetical protein
VQNAGHFGPFPKAAGGTKHRNQVDSHRACVFAAPAQCADPGKAGIDDFLVHPEGGHANDLPGVQAFILTTFHAGQRAAAGTGAAGETGLHMGFRKNVAKDALFS